MKMIPQYFDDETPPGEMDVFNLLAQATCDWVTFHSVDISPLIKQNYRSRRREIDFIVIIPEIGIMCIEVKSHKSITFDGVQWSPHSIKKSPFSQSSSAAATFYKALIQLWPEAKKIPVLHCCIFPNSYFYMGPNLHAQEHELIDKGIYRSFKTSNDFTNYLKEMTMKGLEANSPIRPLKKELSKRDILSLIKICQPLSKVRQTKREEIDYLEQESSELLKSQQKVVWELALLNSRVIVNGGAGTGKTLIAILLARHMALAGMKVGFFCHNKLVGDWIKSQVEVCSTNDCKVVAGPINSTLAHHVGIKIPSNPEHEFWEVLPSKIVDSFEDNKIELFDIIILDEAQDILANDHWVEALNKILIGGFQNGSYVFFGDYENQTLFHKNNLEQNIELIELDYIPTKWNLTENCRNYKEVGDAAVALSGMQDSPYSNYMKTKLPSISLYEIVEYNDTKSQVDQVEKAIKGILKSGYKPCEITLLSFSPIGKASIKVGDRLVGSTIKRFSIGQEHISLESIYTFKGMENKIIIFFDITLSNNIQKRNLMYTGISRATDAIRLFIHQDSKEALLSWLIDSY